MKYWNKSKETRERCWTKIDGPAYYSVEEVKRWCQNYPSKSKFFFGKPRWDNAAEFKGFHWWWFFENSEDALIFKMKFLGPKSETNI